MASSDSRHSPPYIPGTVAGGPQPRPRANTILSTSPASPFPKFRFSPMKPPTSLRARRRWLSATSDSTYNAAVSECPHDNDSGAEEAAETEAVYAPDEGAGSMESWDGTGCNTSHDDSVGIAKTSKLSAKRLGKAACRKPSPPAILLPNEAARPDDSFYLELVNECDRSSVLIPLRSNNFIWNHEAFISPYSPHYRHWTNYCRLERAIADDNDDDSDDEVGPQQASSYSSSASAPSPLATSTHYDYPQGSQSSSPSSSSSSSRALRRQRGMRVGYQPYTTPNASLPPEYTVLWTAGTEDMNVHEILID